MEDHIKKKETEGGDHKCILELLSSSASMYTTDI